MSKKKASGAQQNKATKSVVAETNLRKEVSEKKLFWWLFAIGFALFASTLGHGFVLDDQAVIEKNAIVQQGFAGIPKLFTTFYWEGYWNSNAGLYRPLSMVMFAVEWGISPNNPFIHHFVNVLLYACTIGLLFKVIRLLLPSATPWLAFAVSLLFAAHPMHTEVVANIKSRDEILCFLFFLLAFRQLLKSHLATLQDQLITAGLFFLCLLSKEAGVLFLPAFVLYFLLFRKESILTLVKRFAPLVIVTSLWLGLHQWVINSSVHERINYTYLDNSLVGCPDKATQVATGFAVLGKYIWKAVVPIRMSYDYSYNEIPCVSFGSPLVIGTLLLVFGLLFLAWKIRKTHPLITFGIVFFFLTIALATHLFTLIGTTMGDRLLYAPSLGICLVIVGGVFHLFKKATAEKPHFSGLYTIVVLALVFGLISFRRNRDWASNETLFAADVTHAPNSARVHFNQGALLMAQLPEDLQLQQSRLPEIITAFERSLTIDPRDNGAHTNLGVCYYRMGAFKKSIYHSKEALKTNPDDSGILTNLGDAYFSDNDYKNAISVYQKVIGRKSTEAATFNRMGTAYFNLKKYPEAISIFEKGLKKAPDHSEMRMNLANCYGASGKLSAARLQLLEVVKLQPSNQKAIQLIVMLSEQLGDKEMATAYAAKLSQPNP